MAKLFSEWTRFELSEAYRLWVGLAVLASIGQITYEEIENYMVTGMEGPYDPADAKAMLLRAETALRARREATAAAKDSPRERVIELIGDRPDG